MFAVISLLIIYLMILRSVGGNKMKIDTSVTVAQPVGEKDWTVYGTMGCGWTRKQLEYMKSKGVSHRFVDCDKGECPGMDAFPTMIHTSGEKVVGYKEV